MACSSIFRFIIYHRRCCIQGWSIFFEKDSWLAWMPRAVWWADVLEHKWFLCFIFNTPCSIHPFPPFTQLPLTVNVFLSLRSLVVSYLFLASFLWNYSFYFHLCFLSLFQIITQFPFPFSLVLTGCKGVFVVLFNREWGLDLLEGTRTEVYFGQTAGPRH